MLAHRLDPMQPQTVQHGAGALHDAEDNAGQDEPHEEQTDDHDHGKNASLLEGDPDGHGPQDDRELLMGER